MSQTTNTSKAAAAVAEAPRMAMVEEVQIAPEVTDLSEQTAVPEIRVVPVEDRLNSLEKEISNMVNLYANASNRLDRLDAIVKDSPISPDGLAVEVLATVRCTVCGLKLDGDAITGSFTRIFTHTHNQSELLKEACPNKGKAFKMPIIHLVETTKPVKRVV